MSIKRLSSKDFKAEVMQSDVPVFVDVYTEWCEPCREIDPLLHELAEDYGAETKFVKVDVDWSKRIAKQLGITRVPTFLLFEDGVEVRRLTGAQDRSSLERLLKTG